MLMVATVAFIPLLKMADSKLTRNTLSVFIGALLVKRFDGKIHEWMILSKSKRVCVIVYEFRLTLTSNHQRSFLAVKGYASYGRMCNRTATPFLVPLLRGVMGCNDDFLRAMLSPNTAHTAVVSYSSFSQTHTHFQHKCGARLHTISKYSHRTHASARAFSHDDTKEKPKKGPNNATGGKKKIGCNNTRGMHFLLFCPKANSFVFRTSTQALNSNKLNKKSYHVYAREK